MREHSSYHRGLAPAENTVACSIYSCFPSLAFLREIVLTSISDTGSISSGQAIKIPFSALSFSYSTRMGYIKQDVQPSIGHERSGSIWGGGKRDKNGSASWLMMELACSDCAARDGSESCSDP